MQVAESFKVSLIDIFNGSSWVQQPLPWRPLGAKEQNAGWAGSGLEGGAWQEAGPPSHGFATHASLSHTVSAVDSL